MSVLDLEFVPTASSFKDMCLEYIKRRGTFNKPAHHNISRRIGDFDVSLRSDEAGNKSYFWL
jgi:hypothetical protein